VYGRDGMDEVSLGATTLVGELKDGQITEYEIHPEDFGLTMASNRTLRVETAEDSKTMLLNVLNNHSGPAKDIVVLNAGVALYAANVANSMQAGINKARAAIESGAAKMKLDALVGLTQHLAA
jgi:anthranilate phosphoribosyltransferase